MPDTAAPPSRARANPYADLPRTSFWRHGVAAAPDLDPIIAPPFQIGRDDQIATAGSCFAQHLARAIVRRGYRYLVTEPDPEAELAVYPARFGNIYTARQLRQLFDRAYGLFEPREEAWTYKRGFVDPFRPRVATFDTMEDLLADRTTHFACVRSMFENCDVFTFTLGLTESWESVVDGAVYPLAPGVHGGALTGDHRFHNLSVDEIVADLDAFLAKFRVVNPAAKVLITVSPVPLVATYEPRHVLVSNTYSKAALRVAAEMICQRRPGTAYFPSYEIITQGGYFGPDRREVSADGVAHVMEVFARHYLGEALPRRERVGAAGVEAAAMVDFEREAAVVCDEEAIES